MPCYDFLAPENIQNKSWHTFIDDERYQLRSDEANYISLIAEVNSSHALHHSTPDHNKGGEIERL